MRISVNHVHIPVAVLERMHSFCRCSKNNLARTARPCINSCSLAIGRLDFNGVFTYFCQIIILWITLVLDRSYHFTTRDTDPLSRPRAAAASKKISRILLN